jgi:energy-coupling factor transporter ATP-binding protein EcfA2
MLESRRRLRADSPNAVLETVFACDDYPSTTDDLGASKSTAAFLRAHGTHIRTWTLADWRKSPFAAFVSKVQAASCLDDEAFLEFWSHTDFLANGQGRYLANSQQSSSDLRRIQEIAALLPRLVSDPADRDRWTLEDILTRLNWREPFQLRHGHAFPVDALYESNASTQQALQQVLSTVTRGYVSLVGPPGCGKSTLLAAGLLPTPRAVVLRYLAFLPAEGHGLGRAEAFDFLHDLVKQLKQHGFGERTMPGTELPELQAQLLHLMNEAGERFRKDDVRTLIVVDGLDHVPREERPKASFLGELPLPHAIPDGIVFILGTQHLNLDGIPPSVSDQANQPDRRVVVSSLSRTAVSRLADAAGLPDDVDREILYLRTDGHALSTRYAIMALLGAATPEQRTEWLRSGPAYGGDVSAFYERAWHELQQNTEARDVLAYLALAEGPISPNGLDALVGEQATDSAWNAAGHLLTRDYQAAWSVFHNSFRLFLQAKTRIRHGVVDEAQVRRRYQKLADIARDAGPDDPQRWMELRYRARAEDATAVANLINPERFRSQFIRGRDPGDIRDDIAIAFGVAKAQRRADLLLDLMFSAHEISMRAEALGDDVFEAFIALGNRQAALGLLNADGITLTVTKGYELVDAFLHQRELSEARRLFDSIEPIGQLLGAETTAHHATDVLAAWAERALVFREPGQILASLARLRADPRPGAPFDLESWREHLKMLAARGQLNRHPDLIPDDLMAALEIDPDNRPVLLFLAARSAFEAEKDDLAIERLALLVQVADELAPTYRRELARIALRLGKTEAAAAFLHKISAPTLEGWTLTYNGEEQGREVRQIITHASLLPQIGQAAIPGATPQSQLLQTFQRRLEMLGRLWGEGLAKHRPSVEPVRELHEFVIFLQHAEGDGHHNSERWAMDKVLELVLAAVVASAHSLGQEVFSQVTHDIDTVVGENAERLGHPKVRRAYALEAFRCEQNSDRAESRIIYRLGSQNGPGEQLAEAACTAKFYVSLGLPQKGRSILEEMHSDGLGYARPAKKDPQYAAWRELLIRACDEDPARRPERLLFFGRLLTGMAETEGEGAARRIAGTFLEQAAQAGPEWATHASDVAEGTGLVSWRGLVQGLVRGVTRRRPDLSVAASVLVGRLALPFASDSSENPYPDIIRAAPEAQAPAVVRHAVACLETDCHQTRRIQFLEEVVEAAMARGIPCGSDALARWRAELPAPTSGNSPENPFFLVRTLADFNGVLERIGKDAKSWDLVPAFARILPRIPFDTAKATFEGNELLQRDERAIEGMAEAALSAGRQDEAITYVASLKQMAMNKGGWGDGWFEPTKQRYHRLDVRLRGDVARLAAFDAFTEDLANRRGSADYLLPDLCDVFELLSPRPTWADAWASLEGLLRHFREYRHGVDLEPVSPTTLSDEHTLGGILYRAFSITSLELSKMSRTAALELMRVPGGEAVVASVLPLLWKAGGHLALEAAQIAWECRDAATIRESAVPLLPEMLDSDDIAIRRTSAFLARAWDQNASRKRGELPALYRLELPRTPHAARFDPPSGISPTSSGLYAEDVNTWTWPLREALETTAKASGLEIVNLRTRAAQLMDRLGGTGVFGPEATNREIARLRCLRLHSSYRKLPVRAAFQAARELLGELDAAEAIDPRALPVILNELAAFPDRIATLPPCPRPLGVSSAEIDEPDHSTDSRVWRDRVEQDVVVPKLDGHLVLAATASHRRHQFQKEWTVEQYYGPNASKGQEGLSIQLLRLPKVLVLDELYTLYDGPAPGAVVHPLANISGSVPSNMVALCPAVASEMGWHSDPLHLFTYLDSQDQVVAQTLYWRDGGVHSREADTGVFSVGYVLVVREDRAEEIAPYLASETVSRAWRATAENGTHGREVKSAAQHRPHR